MFWWSPKLNIQIVLLLLHSLSRLSKHSAYLFHPYLPLDSLSLSSYILVRLLFSTLLGFDQSFQIETPQVSNTVEIKEKLPVLLLLQSGVNRLGSLTHLPFMLFCFLLQRPSFLTTLLTSFFPSQTFSFSLSSCLC